jgi:hypothetical protein
MQLNSSGGASVELRIAGYQSPDPGALAPDHVWVRRAADSPEKWEPNWLQVCGHVTVADGRAWAFDDPCLTTWEARELGDWLREVAAGTEPPFRGYREPGGWLVFTEPNLGFTLHERTAGRVRIRVDFTAEVKPPWFERGPEHAPSYLVYLDVSAAEVARAAESWMHDLEEFPER